LSLGLILISTAGLIAVPGSQLVLCAVAAVDTGLISQLALSAVPGLSTLLRSQLVLSAIASVATTPVPHLSLGAFARLQAGLSPELDLIPGTDATAGTVSQPELVLSTVVRRPGDSRIPLSSCGIAGVGCDEHRYRERCDYCCDNGHHLEVHHVTSFPFSFPDSGYGPDLEKLWRTHDLVVWFGEASELHPASSDSNVEGVSHTPA